MRMAELSSSSGVPIPTIHFYLRERLLPPGERTSPNQARYDASHLRRLKLIRALLEMGGLSVVRAREVLAYIEAKDGDAYAILGGVQYALTPARQPGDDPAGATAVARVDRLLAERAWRVRPQNPSRASLADVLATLERLGQHDVAAMLDTYADAAESLSRREVDDLLSRKSLEVVAEGVIAYDVLGDAMLSALRRLTQESVTTERLRPDPPAPRSRVRPRRDGRTT